MYPLIIDSMVRFLPVWLVWWLVFINSDLALGFLGGKEVQAAGIGNAGLRDRARLACHCILALCWSAIERFAMKWIQKHIAAFGGDPERVTMYASSNYSWIWSGLEHCSFFIVGARVQVLRPLVYTLSWMMEILRVSSTERSWYGCF